MDTLTRHLASCSSYLAEFRDFDQLVRNTLEVLKLPQEVALIGAYVQALFDGRLQALNKGQESQASHRSGQKPLLSARLQASNFSIPAPRIGPLVKPPHLTKSAYNDSISFDDDLDRPTTGSARLPQKLAIGKSGLKKPILALKKPLIQKPSFTFSDDADPFGCLLCGSSAVDRLLQMPCGHLVCVPCVEGFVAKKMSAEIKMTCLSSGCSQTWSIETLIQICKSRPDTIGSLTTLETASEEMNHDVVRCTKCQAAFCFEPGRQSDSPERTEDGRPLKPLYRRLFAEDRFKCASCSAEQCKLCRSSPYHIGYTCLEQQTLVPCRYCCQPLEHAVDVIRQPMSDICTTNSDCMTKAEVACLQALDCGHRCGGYVGEKKHPSCIIPKCPSYLERKSQICTYCNESLESGPFVQLRCRDLFHYRCLEQCIRKKWCTRRITFGYLKCPNCKVNISIPLDCKINTALEPAKELRKKIGEITERRLMLDKRENDGPLTDSSHRFYQQPKEYAMAIYACYECGKCKKPFIGGQVSCEVEANADLGEDSKEAFVCFDCSGGKKCSIHGSESMVNKCKFCCQPATWFCWGNTHFCNDCHEKQIKDRNYSKNGPFLQCNPRDCKFGSKHPKNPSEYCAGCAICGINL